MAKQVAVRDRQQQAVSLGLNGRQLQRSLTRLTILKLKKAPIHIQAPIFFQPANLLHWMYKGPNKVNKMVRKRTSKEEDYQGTGPARNRTIREQDQQGQEDSVQT